MQRVTIVVDVDDSGGYMNRANEWLVDLKWPKGMLRHVATIDRVCQANGVIEGLPCSWRESGGVQCENTKPGHGDDEHWISQHTIRHSLAGNGYTCDSVDNAPVGEQKIPVTRVWW